MQTMISQAADSSEPNKSAPKIDVRVIIDISGSMKKNDPKNLRVPALKLLVGLLPEGVNTGVWTFGTKVKPLVKHGIVDKKWKARANKAVRKISSRDLYTNVESALKIVAQDWDEDDTETKRNIILLTDGMVDVSKKQEISDQSRQRIIDEVLPILQNKNVTINTISLSENADLELMDALAIGTDGWSEQVNEAEQLQRVFLHMFEKSAPRDTVPLEDNKFTIDKMIEEFTLLVFRNNDVKQTTITPPKGEKFDRKSRPKNIAWLEESGYDLITITKPTAGIWEIDADIDPDNRVMVVTKLKLYTSDIPNTIFLGEEYDYKFWVTSDEEKIKKDAFYELIEMKMTQASGGSIEEVWDIEKRNNDNEFINRVGKTFSVGKMELSVIIDGKTFKRQHKQTINVYEQIYDLEDESKQRPNGDNLYQLRIIPKQKILNLSTFKATANITEPDGTNNQVEAKMVLRGNAWLVTINDPQPGQYTVVLDVETKTKSDRRVTVTSDPINFGEPIVEEVNDEEEPKEIIEETVEETDWIKIGIILIVFNLILFSLIAGVFIFLKKRKGCGIRG